MYALHILGFGDIPDSEKKDRKGPEMLVPERFGGVDGKEISQMMQLSHASTLRDVVKKRQKHSTFMPTTIANVPQIRMTRRIIGEYTMCSDER